ncbi:hypothetical protein [Mycobacterium sherrisii]|uniref:hypothetical protein n=1 Tax=Mycobacterium sherrisii TaxID=243061 RepID=UPI0012F519BB|nr:hypothetical protein [Mycobacterium sherrisii]
MTAVAAPFAAERRRRAELGRPLVRPLIRTAPARHRHRALVLETRTDAHGFTRAVRVACSWCGGSHWGAWSGWHAPDTIPATCGTPAAQLQLVWAQDIAREHHKAADRIIAAAERLGTPRPKPRPPTATTTDRTPT